jgi:hypothetical protein
MTRKNLAVSQFESPLVTQFGPSERKEQGETVPGLRKYLLHNASH